LESRIGEQAVSSILAKRLTSHAECMASRETGYQPCLVAVASPAAREASMLRVKTSERMIV
jgi:hypothetical protein